MTINEIKEHLANLELTAKSDRAQLKLAQRKLAATVWAIAQWKQRLVKMKEAQR